MSWEALGLFHPVGALAFPEGVAVGHFQLFGLNLSAEDMTRLAQGSRTIGTAVMLDAEQNHSARVVIVDDPAGCKGGQPEISVGLLL